MSDTFDSTTPEMASLEGQISDTQRSLNRKIDEIGRRVQPDEVRAELKEALKRRMDPEPYLGYIASGLVAVGTVMAVKGWRRSRHTVLDIPADEISAVAVEVSPGCGCL